MANLRDVRLRMKAISQTLQVTKAMNLISTAKLRKGRMLLEDTEPYFTRIQKTMGNILHSAGNVANEYFQKNENGRCAIVIITSDKGLAGGYNANIFRYVLKICEEIKNPVLILVGNVGQRYFVNSPYMVLESFSFGGKLPSMEEAQEISDYVLSQYDWGVFSEIRVVYTHMYNALRLLPSERLALPLDEKKMRAAISDTPFFNTNAENKKKDQFEYIPSSEQVFKALVPIYIKGIIYGCLVESYASEQSARMSAMDEASRNGQDMLGQQQLFYNRVRQASITQEVTEIVSGSAALME